MVKFFDPSKGIEPLSLSLYNDSARLTGFGLAASTRNSSRVRNWPASGTAP